MRIVLQRVSSASVCVDSHLVGSIGRGYLLLLGVGAGDTTSQADQLIDKIRKLRIFPDEHDKINLSIVDTGGEVLVVSQFTLYADCKKGNRPSFVNAANPVLAQELYAYFVQNCGGLFAKVESGIFGADMKVELTNDGPFTLVLESA